MLAFSRNWSLPDPSPYHFQEHKRIRYWIQFRIILQDHPVYIPLEVHHIFTCLFLCDCTNTHYNSKILETKVILSSPQRRLYSITMCMKYTGTKNTLSATSDRSLDKVVRRLKKHGVFVLKLLVACKRHSEMKLAVKAIMNTSFIQPYKMWWTMLRLVHIQGSSYFSYFHWKSEKEVFLFRHSINTLVYWMVTGNFPNSSSFSFPRRKKYLYEDPINAHGGHFFSIPIPHRINSQQRSCPRLDYN